MSIHSPCNCLCVICQTFRRSDRNLDHDGDKAPHVNRLIQIMKREKYYLTQCKELQALKKLLLEELSGDGIDDHPLELPEGVGPVAAVIEGLVKVILNVCGETVEKRRITRRLLRQTEGKLTEQLTAAATQIKTHQGEVRDKNLEIRALEAQLNAQRRIVSAKDHELNAMSLKLKTGNTSIRDLEMEIWEQSRTIKAKDSELMDMISSADTTWETSMEQMQTTTTQMDKIDHLEWAAAVKDKEVLDLRLKIVELGSRETDTQRPRKRLRASSAGP